MVFGRRQRGVLPIIDTRKTPNLKEKIEKRDIRRREKLERTNETLKSLKKFKPGDAVIIQDPLTHRWKSKGIVKSVRNQGRSYNVETEHGRMILRNRRYLKSCPQTSAPHQIENEMPPIAKDPTPRRSPRF
ncbi:Hypothetical predicted protein [Paramuricea clavata]|uniref:Uncharacterized protein n=1 Tax=Paramuricea clavata TaxID=317549 RepID=A0A6S7LVE1_PARCT|nr:Hypothetical predicted protein [Paramuricea clavata]